MKRPTVFVLSAKSESGDSYGPFVFDYEMTDDEEKAFWQKQCPAEWDNWKMDGPGRWGSYLYTSSCKCYVFSEGEQNE